MDMMSQAEFARHRGVSRCAVTYWKRDGLLVMRGKFVDVLASEKLIDARPEKFRGGVTNRRKVYKFPKKSSSGDPAERSFVPADQPRRPIKPGGAAVITCFPDESEETIEEAVEAKLEALLPDAAGWTHAEATRRKEVALALTRQLEYDMKAGNVVEVSRIAETVAIEYGVLKDRLLQIPGKVADRVCGLDRYTVEKILRDEVYEALSALSVNRWPE